MKLIIKYIVALVGLLSATSNLFAQDTSKSITADFSVSPSGALTYQVPFEVPSYVLGHFPNLGLSFNSQAGDGIAGYGWSISGLSSITRTSATNYYDGFVDPVDFDNKDRYILDGQRLLLKSGSYGNGSSTYETEQYSNLKIEAVGKSTFGSQYGPAHFIVYHPNGTRYWYGAHNSSHSKLEWSLSRIEDTQGNRVDFYYSVVNETLRLNSISDSKTKVAVSFNYTTKGSALPIGIGRSFFVNNRLLYRVNVTVDGKSYHSYRFSTEKTSTGLERLKTIRQTNRLDEYLPDIKFKYENGTNTFASKKGKFSGGDVGSRSKGRIISGDFNGDEKLDYLNFAIDRDENEFKGIKYLESSTSGVVSKGSDFNTTEFDEVFVGRYVDSRGELSSKDGLILLKRDGESNRFYFNLFERIGGFWIRVRQIEWLAPRKLANGEIVVSKNYVAKAKLPEFRYQVGDYNGDGVTDILPINEGGSYRERICREVCIDPNDPNIPGYVKRSLPQQQPELTTQNSESITTRSLISNNRPCSIGQDSYQECETRTNYNSSGIYFISLNPETSTDIDANKPVATTTLSDNTSFYSIDVDGDGLTEILKKVNSRLSHIRLVEFNKEANRYVSSGYNLGSLKNDLPIFPGDYNGDGKTDLVQPQKNGSTVWHFYISNGISFKHYEKDIGIKYEIFKREHHTFTKAIPRGPASQRSISSDHEFFYLPMDFNKDGRTDLIKHKVVAPWKESEQIGASQQWVEFFSNTSKLTSASTTSAYFNFKLEKSFFKDNEGRPRLGHPIAADFSHRYLGAQYAYADSSEGLVNVYEYSGDQRAQTRLKSIENNGLTTTISYQGLGGSIGNTTVNAYLPDFGKQSFKFPYNKITQAKDFKVVAKVRQTFNGLTRDKQFRYCGLVSHTKGLGMLGFNAIASTNWVGTNIAEIWNVTLYDLKRKRIVLGNWSTNESAIGASVTDHLLSQAAYEYEYKVNANKSFVAVPKKVISTDYLKGGLKTTVTNTYDDYYNVLTSKQAYPGGSKTTTNTYYNNPSGSGANYYIGRPKTKNITTVLGSDRFNTAEQYTYANNFIKELKTKGNNTSWLTETYKYDSFGNIISKTISGSGVADRTESSVYDSTGRFMISATDIEGLTTTYTYDKKLGHLLKETDPFGKSQKFAYDGWNRLTKQTDYLGNSISTTYKGQTGGGLKISTTSSLGGGSETFINRLGWETQQRTRNALHQWVNTKIDYDATGKVQRESQPYFSSPSQWTSYSYDEFNRPIRQQMYNGLIVTTTYDGLTVSVNDGTKTVSTTSDAVGNTISMTDPGGTINYIYYANNTPKETNYGGHKITTKIDGWGRKTELNDPAAGQYHYVYDILGQLLVEYNANGATNYTYDDYGKLTKKTITSKFENRTITYKYDSTTKLITNVSEPLNPYIGFGYSYTYDEYQRVTKVTESNANFARFARETVYDTKGRVDKESYTSAVWGPRSGQNSKLSVKNHYHSASGQLYKVTDAVSNKKLWQLNSLNARDQVLKATTASQNISITNTYDSYGLPKEQALKSSGTTAATVHKLTYNFDAKRGNLLNRTDSRFSKGRENFKYDNQDRLTKISGAYTHQMDYGASGTIKTNSLIGNYKYQPATTYQLAGIDLNSKGDSYYKNKPLQQITYNLDKNPLTIKEGGEEKVRFTYGPFENRSTARITKKVQNEEKKYQKDYASIFPGEIVATSGSSNIKFITYVGGDAYTAPIAHINEHEGTNTTEGYYTLFRDHLGSIMSIVNQNGTTVERTHYGAWGTVEQYWDTKNNKTLSCASILGRGYTGHEHFENVGLIHMNGRMYDAKLGRFLSPDNFIQDPFNTQSFNRYGYVWNNPLKFNDPSGEFLITAIIIGAVLGGVSAAVQGGDFGDILTGAFIGALAGVVTGGIGNVASGAAFFAKSATLTIGGGILGGAAGGFVAGATSSWMNGGNFGDGLKAGFKGAAVGAVGGAFSVIGGGSFVGNMAWGAAGGAASGAFAAAISGSDILSGALYGAATGAAFAAISSLPEAVRNYRDGYGFGTNHGRFSKMVKSSITKSGAVDPVKAQNSLDFFTKRYGGPKLNFSKTNTDTSAVTGKIRIGAAKFAGGAGHVKRAISHEFGHYYNDIVWSSSGKPTGKWNDNTSAYGNDGSLGYNYAIENSGRYHIGLGAIRDSSHLTSAYSSSAWSNYGIKKWFSLIPRRFF